jgi:hypothetical protein
LSCSTLFKANTMSADLSSLFRKKKTVKAVAVAPPVEAPVVFEVSAAAPELAPAGAEQAPEPLLGQVEEKRPAWGAVVEVEAPVKIVQPAKVEINLHSSVFLHSFRVYFSTRFECIFSTMLRVLPRRSPRPMTIPISGPYQRPQSPSQ